MILSFGNNGRWCVICGANYYVDNLCPVLDTAAQLTSGKIHFCRKVENSFFEPNRDILNSTGRNTTR
jgi:hypothetical protein